MVQEFHVVRCFSCQSFQVQQVKKVNKWTCKLCGQKQSLLKEFGRGSGADCRRHVQKLNAMRGAMLEEQGRDTLSLWEAKVEVDEEDEPEELDKHPHTEAQVSCWSKYLDAPEEEELEDEETVLIDRQQPQGNNMTDRKRKMTQGWTDKAQQSNGCRLKGRNPVQPSAASRATSLDKTSLNQQTSRNHILNQTDLTHTSLDKTSLNQQTSRNHSLNQTDLTHTSLDKTSLNHQTSRNHHSLNQADLTHTSLDKTSLIQTSRTYNHLNQTSLKHTSEPHASPPSKKSRNPLSANSGPGSRWACFLSSSSQVTTHNKEPSDKGWSQSVGGAASQSSSDITHQNPPLNRPLPPHPSMFESGEDFDDELLTVDWL